MTFQNPGALWWFLPVGGVILALYFLKMRRQDFRVPAVFLWPERVDEVRANSLFQKLRPNWLLFLQLLAAAAVIVAFARPMNRQSGFIGDVTVMVLDSSASMGATDVSPSRFDDAKRQVRHAIDSANSGDRLALIEAGPYPRVIFPLGNNPALQRQALDRVRQTDAEGSMGEALRLAAAIVAQQPSGRIVVLSDGIFADVANFSPGKAQLIYRKIGLSDKNVAIQSFASGETTAGRKLFVSLKNFGESEGRGRLRLYAEGKLINAFDVRIAGRGEWSQTLGLPPSAKLLEARFEGRDMLAADNYQADVAETGARIRVLLITSGNPFLERALAIDPRVVLDKTSSVPAAERAGTNGVSNYDIVVFDEGTHPAVKCRRTLSFGASSRGLAAEVSGKGSRGSFVTATAHPVMAGVDLETAYIQSVVAATPAPGSEIVAESTAGPLIVVRERSNPSIVVAFSPMKSDFPLQIGFPIFIGNALTFLMGTQGSTAIKVKPGVPFALASESQVEVSGADGVIGKADAEQGFALVRGIDRVGRYGIKGSEMSKTVVVAMQSPDESAIAPRDRLNLGGSTVAAVRAPSRLSDLWKLAVGLGLIVLVVEWCVFMRKS
ncbi:MAG: hypothetical protein HONBIEJF_01679 [Fimbriimonadaceae bacterium]|nr:hypothetical protein [Fimbriimonadaceae bacterium]